MRGDLSETSVADLCRGLSDAEATGAVELDGPEGAARVFFRRGNVYWAMSPAPRARLGDRLVNGGLLTADQLESALAAQRESTERLKLGAILVDQGLVSRDVIRVFVQEQILDALFDLMRWRVGTYAFRAGDAVSEKLPIDIPVDQLLVEVSRRQSEWDQIEAAIPHLDMIPDFVLGGSSANAALEPDEFAVLASVDGHRSIRELADALGYSHFEAARIVYGLTLLGIVDVAEDVDEVDPSDDALFDEVSGVFDGPTDTEVDADDNAVDVDVAGEDEAREESITPVGTDEPDDALDEDDVLAGDLELELSDLAEDDLDIAAALEEALGVADTPSESESEPASPRPAVRVHVDDDVTDYAAPRQVTDSGLSPTGEPRRVDVPLPPPPPAPSTRASEIVEQDEDDLTAALAEALGSAGGPAGPNEEPEAADVDADLSVLAELADEGEDEPAGLPAAGEDSDSDEGPAPWVAPADEVAAPDPASDLDDLEELASTDSSTAEPAPDASEDLFQGVEPDDGTEAPAAASAPDPVTDDSDFDALIDQLAGGPGSSGADRDAPYTSTPAASESVSSADESGSERTSSGSGDVSEFLRELSRLALDEPADGGGEGPAKKDDEDGKSEADAASEAAAQSREAQRSASRSESDEKKKRGLFGWGR